MVPALGQGLLISSVTRNQFLAAQITLFSGFLPAFMLSDFLYEIDHASADTGHHLADPGTLFRVFAEDHLSGRNIWAVFVPNLLAMAESESCFSS